MTTGYDYREAFSRNLGLVGAEEQSRLRRSRVAVAGLGGVGGVHLTTHLRLGVGNFHIADLDTFELANFNRQEGATMASLGRPKTEVMAEIAREINPTAEVRCFPDGLREDNVEAFLEGVDVVVDGLDFFALPARALLYRTARSRGVPVVAAGPVGCSAALLVFLPGGMSWHDYFALDLGRNEAQRSLLFALGTAPRATQLPYIDRTQVSFQEHRVPSLAPAVHLCAGVAATETLKLLLGRGRVLAAPWYQQFDAYRGRYVRGKLRWGNRGPVQRLKFRLFCKYLGIRT